MIGKGFVLINSKNVCQREQLNQNIQTDILKCYHGLVGSFRVASYL